MYIFSHGLQLEVFCFLYFDVPACGNTAAAQRTANPGDTACQDAVLEINTQNIHSECRALRVGVCVCVETRAGPLY